MLWAQCDWEDMEALRKSSALSECLLWGDPGAGMQIKDREGQRRFLEGSGTSPQRTKWSRPGKDDASGISGSGLGNMSAVSTWDYNQDRGKPML